MKNYLVRFNVVDGKIPMIKLVRNLTQMGLRECKDFVEAEINTEFSQDIEFIITHEQLSQFLVHNLLTPSNSSYCIISAQELEKSKMIDLTKLNSAPF